MASDHVVYDGDALSAVIPTTEGQVGIMAHHSNIIMAVVPGILEYVPADEDGRALERHYAVVANGLIKVENNELMVLVDTAEDPEAVDEARAERAEARAREELKHSDTMREHAMAEAELSRALSRIKATRTRRNHKI